MQTALEAVHKNIRANNEEIVGAVAKLQERLCALEAKLPDGSLPHEVGKLGTLSANVQRVAAVDARQIATSGPTSALGKLLHRGPEVGK